MDNLLYIKNISITIHHSKNFIYILFYFFEIDNNGKPVLLEIKKKLNLVKKLKVKILVSNKILVPKKFILDLSNKKVTIFSCNIKIQILIKS